MQKKNLILGVIKGYDYEKLNPFITSLQRTAFDGELVLLVNGISNDTLSKLKNKGVVCKQIDYRGSGALNSWSRFWPVLKPICSMPFTSLNRFILKKILPLQSVRFFHYKDFLIEHAGKYNNVLLTDVRDVIFQADPFENKSYDKIECFEEYGVLGEDRLFNIPWIQKLYGEHSADSFSHKKILCSGTIIGSIPKMIEFLDDFEMILKKSYDYNYLWADQGIYNYLIRMHLQDKVEIVKYGDGVVLTISDKDEPKKFMINEFLYNSDKKVFPVIHQYDRSKALQSIVDKVYIS